MDVGLKKSTPIHFGGGFDKLKGHSLGKGFTLNGGDWGEEDYEEEEDVIPPYRPTNQLLNKFNIKGFKDCKPSDFPRPTDNESDFIKANTQIFLSKYDTKTDDECVYFIGSEQNMLVDSEPSKFFIFWQKSQDLNMSIYIKAQYALIHPKIKILPQINPSFEKLSQGNSLRLNLPNRLLILHYLGHNFPMMQDGIPTFDELTRHPRIFSLQNLFEIFQTPTIFIFDCSNAAIAINQIRSAAQRSKQSDWFCFCTTDIGECIPDDPHLPRDFLTSCIFTPAEMALTCHILQYFRNSRVGPNFPLDGSIQKILEGRKEYLNRTIYAIIDAIAADRFPEPLYDKLIRKRSTIRKITRGFLLCQYLLKPYLIHPQSRPLIQDLSSHPLWMNLKMELDLAISASMSPGLSIYHQSIFESTLQTMHHIELSKTSVVELSILLNAEGSESMVEAFTVLSHYASLGEQQRTTLARNSSFKTLIDAILNESPKSNAFHPLCYFACSVLLCDPFLIFGINNTMNTHNLADVIFDTSIPTDTRVLVAALFACLLASLSSTVVIKKAEDRTFQSQIFNLMNPSTPLLTKWCLIISKRFFDSVNSSPQWCIRQGFHALVASFTLHPDFEVRTAALSVMISFIGCDDVIDAEMFAMALPTLFDCSSLVRFHLVLFLSKFISEHQASFSTDIQLKIPLLINEFLESWLPNYPPLTAAYENPELVGDCVDAFANGGTNIPMCAQITQICIERLLNDPNPSVKKAAKSLRNQLTEVEEDDGKDCGFDYSKEPNDDCLLEVSDLSLRVALRQIVDSGRWIHRDTSSVRFSALPPASLMTLDKTYVKAPTIINELTGQPKRLAYDFLGRDIVAAVGDKLIYGKKELRHPDTTSLALVNWGDEPMIIAADMNGNTTLWNPKDEVYTESFMCDLGSGTGCSCVVEPMRTETKIISSRGKGGVIRMWDASALRFGGEWALGVDANVTALCLCPRNPYVVAAGYENGELAMLDMRANEPIGRSRLQQADPIFTIRPNVGAEIFYFAATYAGTVSRFSSLDAISIIRQGTPLADFDILESAPLMALAPTGQRAIISTVDGSSVHEVPAVAVALAMHQSLPIVSFGESSGRIIECEISTH